MDCGNEYVDMKGQTVNGIICLSEQLDKKVMIRR